MSENVKLPPETLGQTYSEREQAFKNCTFFTLRKVATEGLKHDTGQMLYVSADGKPFCDYNDTIRDRNLVRQRILEYELAQGWIVDDRGAQVAPVQPVAVQSVQPAVPAQETMTSVPVPIIAAASMTINAAPAPQQPQPQPQPPPSDAGAPMGKKRPGPRLPSAVAPPTAAVTPTPPPGAMVVQAAPVQATAQMAPTVVVPVTEQPQVQQFTQPAAAPAPIMSFTVRAAPVQAPEPQAQTTQPPAASDKKLDAIGSGLEIISRDVEAHRKDFSQFVSNMSDQVNSSNKAIKAHDEALKDIQKTLEMLMAAVHHMYVMNPTMQAKMAEMKMVAPTNTIEFREYLVKFTVQRP